MKKVLALRGHASCGKTTTIRIVHELLREQSGVREEYLATGKNDLFVILVIDGIKIGITSQGDPKTGLAGRLKRLRDRDCLVIICATRTRGATVAAVNDSQRDGYTIVWREQVAVRGHAAQFAGNKKMAGAIAAEVKAC